jgi:hypothetical protein
MPKGEAGAVVAGPDAAPRRPVARSPAVPGGHRRGKRVLVRIDGAGGTHELLAWLTRCRLFYLVGFSLPGDLASIQRILAAIPNTTWEPAYDADRQPRPGAFVAEVTDLFDLSTGRRACG